MRKLMAIAGWFWLMAQAGLVMADGPVVTTSDPNIIADQIPANRVQAQPAQIPQQQQVAAQAMQKSVPNVPQTVTAPRKEAADSFGPSTFGDLPTQGNAFNALSYLGLGGVGPPKITGGPDFETYIYPDGTEINVSGGLSVIVFKPYGSNGTVTISYVDGKILTMVFKPSTGPVQIWTNPTRKGLS